MVLCPFLIPAVRAVGQERPATGRRRTCFDFGWKFARGDRSDARNPGFDDSGWRDVDLPHDWSIEERFHARAAAGMRGGYVELGTGWYRKRFKVPAELKDGKLFIEFGGIYKDSDVWLNGTHLGKRWYGYATFRYDLTPHVRRGGENLIAVRVNNPKQTCRWYSGSGIYRHVWLEATDKLAVGHWGTHVTTPTVSAESAVVRVETVVTNGYDTAAPCTLATTILDSEERAVAAARAESKVAASGTHTFTQEFAVRRPALWSGDRPALYRARSVVRSGGRTVDTYTTSFGIRETGWSAERGFTINGRSVLLNGVNIHHDLGSLGAAFNERAMERRLEVLKKMGCNSIRTAHNPPAEELLDMCDRMGFYVIDEAFDKWGSHRYATFDRDWPRDLEAMVRRDRNHPSVILWSVGNENWGRKYGQMEAIYNRMVEHARRYDTTRKFTYALSPTYAPRDAKLMDVASLNYQEQMFDRYRKDVPGVVILASETYAYYRGKDGKAQAYYPMNPWLDAANSPDVAGSYVWTGIDYLGEAKARWPYRGWNGSLIDTCGFRKPVSYLHESFWSDEAMVHIAVLSDALKTQKATVKHWGWPKMVSHWTLPELVGKTVKIATFSNCDEVALAVNGKSLGRKRLSDFEDRMICWEAVPYAAGSVSATGYRGGRKVCSHELRTAGPAERIELVPDRSVISPDGQDLSHVVVTIVDANGVLVPDASHKVTFDVAGAGRLLAMDNGDLTCMEPYVGTSRSAFGGRCMALVQAGRRPGTITVRASAAGLEPAEATLESR